jgi:hypothetical protein
VRTALTTQVLKKNNYAVQAGDLAVSLVALDNVNGNSFTATGREVLLFQNTDASPHTITLDSVADSLGRTDSSLTAYSIPANGFIAIQVSQLTGWVQAGTLTINIDSSSALIKVAVLQTN